MNTRDESGERSIVESLAETKRATFGLLSGAVNAHKPPQALAVSAGCAVAADMPEEFRWATGGWTVHLFLGPDRPIEIRWSSPAGAVFDLDPAGHRHFAASIDAPRSPGWPVA